MCLSFSLSHSALPSACAYPFFFFPPCEESEGFIVDYWVKNRSGVVFFAGVPVCCFNVSVCKGSVHEPSDGIEWVDAGGTQPFRLGSRGSSGSELSTLPALMTIHLYNTRCRIRDDSRTLL